MSRELILKDKTKTVLDQIFENKVIHKHSCLSGLCGACRCNKPKEGETRYIEEPLYPVSDHQFLPCVSIIISDFIKIEL